MIHRRIWRHQLSTPGVPQIIDAHYPDHPDGRSVHQPRLQPRSEAEVAFVGIGPGAGRWLKEAGPAGFDTIMPKTLAGASTDRLMHHAHLVTTSGDSHRLAEALAGKGVVPLT
ncbi:hypothetical protein ACFU6I_41190 [Streptomyces sp. NPDC057486]|uniref:hypothetical protein n=1 Tax=Streptomyces sp. NPDC057486 TaxID=3346145 RepID=UPI0036C9F9B2